jgi:transposase
MNKKHTKEEWLEALELYKKGYGSTLIARRTGLDDSDIRRRIRQYLVSGIWQTEIKRPVRVSPSIKKNAVDDVVSQSLSCAEVVVKYGISFDSLKTWLRKYRHGGYEELLATRQKGRPPKMNKAKPKRTKGMSEIERLREENEYLKAENAYLKKLKALDQEENAEMFGIGPVSSMN